jgi:hypothetical protein
LYSPNNPPPPPQAEQNDVASRFQLMFRLKTTCRIFKTYSESFFQGGSGHIIYFFLAPS